MQSGKLNRRIDVLVPVYSRNASGSQVTMWNTLTTTWAAIDIQQSSLVYETATFMSKVAYRITMRYRSDIILDASKRLRYTEPTTGVVHTYEIEAPLNTKAANRELVLMCYELNGKE